LIGGKKRAFEVFVIKLYFKATFERDKLDKFLGASLVIKLSDPEPFTPVNLGLKPSIKSFADNSLGFFKPCTLNSFVNSFAFNFYFIICSYNFYVFYNILSLFCF